MAEKEEPTKFEAPSFNLETLSKSLLGIAALCFGAVALIAWRMQDDAKQNADVKTLAGWLIASGMVSLVCFLIIKMYAISAQADISGDIIKRTTSVEVYKAIVEASKDMGVAVAAADAAFTDRLIPLMLIVEATFTDDDVIRSSVADSIVGTAPEAEPTTT